MADMTIKMKADDLAIDEAAKESFPASDPPAWTASTRIGPRDPGGLRTETPRDVRSRLRCDVSALRKGPRAEHIKQAFLESDFPVTLIPVPHREDIIEGISPGAVPGGELVIAARYDVPDVTGVAALLSLAHVLAGRKFAHGVRLVAYSDAAAYAGELHKSGISVSGVLALHRIGFEVERGMFRSVHDMVALFGNVGSRGLVSNVRSAFGNAASIRALPVPGFLPVAPIDDHKAFWKEGYPTTLVTDLTTLIVRRGGRHVSYDALADIVFGLAGVVSALVHGQSVHRPRNEPSK